MQTHQEQHQATQQAQQALCYRATLHHQTEGHTIYADNADQTPLAHKQTLKFGKKRGESIQIGQSTTQQAS
ncbi:hypothetical protein [Thiolinea disciformis]|uniref:hypothetical protein n=1 Tax=Thiolinea disciformis TaxID=125614 RepID=UPI00036EE518|nr:hypothetical protein [Thiolinea disciformis]